MANNLATPEFNAVTALRAAGVSLEQLPAEQREVIAGLSPSEVQVLIDIQHRLDIDGDEVRAFANPPIIGNILY